MEELLREKLCSSRLVPYGSGGGGCISSGQGYDTDNGRIFVKINGKEGARVMFDGEYASLKAIQRTCSIKVPTPKLVCDHPSNPGALLVTEYINMDSLRKYTAQLGTDIGRMHKHNESVMKKAEQSQSSIHNGGSTVYVEKFGFDVPTCCGFIPQENSWEDDWLSFYVRHKLKQQLDMIEQKSGDREVRDLWPQLERALPGLFKDIAIVPALVHGDLWSGNVAETTAGPVTFDPASFYAHHEYDLGIACMFGGFDQTFFAAYHVYPRQTGHETRNKLYQLFHYLNHWNHFGSGYRGQSISLMKEVIKAA